MKPRYILDTSLSIDGQFYSTDELTGEPRECIDDIKAYVARLSLNTTVRGEPMIERLRDNQHHILDELDGLLAELRSQAEEWFDDLRDQIVYSTEWWVFMGTPLFSCDADAPMVIELQDLKHPRLRHLSLRQTHLRLDAEHARDWDTPHIEHLDLTGCAASPEFLDQLRDNYPQVNIAV